MDKKVIKEIKESMYNKINDIDKELNFLESEYGSVIKRYKQLKEDKEDAYKTISLISH